MWVPGAQGGIYDFLLQRKQGKFLCKHSLSIHCYWVEPFRLALRTNSNCLLHDHSFFPYWHVWKLVIQISWRIEDLLVNYGTVSAFLSAFHLYAFLWVTLQEMFYQAKNIPDMEFKKLRDHLNSNSAWLGHMSNNCWEILRKSPNVSLVWSFLRKVQGGSAKLMFPWEPWMSVQMLWEPIQHFNYSFGQTACRLADIATHPLLCIPYTVIYCGILCTVTNCYKKRQLNHIYQEKLLVKRQA